MSIQKSLRLILFTGTLSFIEMFPTGAPAARCSDMFPTHQAAAQTGSAPYEVVVDTNSFGNGSTVTGKWITFLPIIPFFLSCNKYVSISLELPRFVHFS